MILQDEGSVIPFFMIRKKHQYPSLECQCYVTQLQPINYLD